MANSVLQDFKHTFGREVFKEGCMCLKQGVNKEAECDDNSKDKGRDRKRSDAQYDHKASFLL